MDKLKEIGKKVAAPIEKVMESVPAKKIDVALAVLITLVGLAVYAFVEIGGSQRAGFSFINSIEQRSLDARFRMRGPREHDDRIVLVGIDEKTLQKVGAWPIPRDAYAKMLDQLSAGGARVVAFDVDFPTPEKNGGVEALQKLQEQLGSSASPAVIEKIRELESSSDNDRILADSIKKAGNVVLGHLFLDAERAKSQDAKAAKDYLYVVSGRPFPQTLVVGKSAVKPIDAFAEAGGTFAFGTESNIRILAEAARSYGFFDNNPDADGTMRHASMVMFYKDGEFDNFYPSLPLEALRVYEDIKDQSTAQYVAADGVERMEVGPYSWKTLHDGTALINFTGPYQTYKHYSMADVIDGTVPASTFKGKIVFVGATAKGIGDIRNTPFLESPVFDVNGNPVLGDDGKQKFEQAAYMGVEIHANVLDNMLHSDDPKRGFLKHGFNAEITDIILLLVMGLGLGYAFSRLKPMVSTLVVVASLALFGFIVYIAFAKFGMWLAFVIPALTLVGNYAAITSFRMIFEEREKRKIRKSFSTYLSPGVIALMEKDPKKYLRPGGEMKELTIMFSDIRSFTTISEGLTPDELVLLLNEYLGEMTNILFKRWGTLDKYIGDAIMGFWGSPFPQDDHAIRACACALDMRLRLEELNMKWEAQGKKQLSIGIGLNTGPVNVGNMGSDRRLSWTVMGDNVNLASRLEGQTKDYHVQCIVGEGTYRAAKDFYVFRDLDRIKVKGKTRPVPIYQLLAFAKDSANYMDLIPRWDEANALYRAGRWADAAVKFENILEKYPGDGPSETFLLRCHGKMTEGVPEGEWDGVYVATSK